MSNAPSVLLVEDHQIQRLGLKMSLENLGCCDILGEAANGETAVSEVLRLRPEVVLMDIGLPGIDGIEATWRIKQELPRTRVIMFTTHTTPDDVTAALGAGADAYCSKDLPVEQIANVIDTVMHGEVWLDPAIADALVIAHENKSEEIGGALSETEMQILTLIQSGVDNRQIAQRLNTSCEAVARVMHHIIRRFVEKSEADEKAAVNIPLSGERYSSVQWLTAFVDNLNEEKIFADKYLVEDLIGSGGMGAVFKAKHLFMDREVALKLLRRDVSQDRFVMRNFQREAMMIANLQHKNIIAVYDFGISSNNDPYMVMEYIDGQSLAEILEKQRRLPIRRVINLCMQVCAGLAEAHSKNILHCDLKPSNILILGNEPEELVKLVDFGLAQIAPCEPTTQSKLTDKHFVVGTPLYMSPEQCSNHELDKRSDIYSLGCIMYEALTGVNVFRGNTPPETFANQFQLVPPPMSSVYPEGLFPPRLEQCVSKMLSKNPGNRPPTVRHVMALLLSALGQMAPTAAIESA